MKRFGHRFVGSPAWIRRPGPACILAGLLWIQPAPVRAHRLDEILQASLIDIEPDQVRITLNLTPGVETAVTLLPLLDLDHDDVLSPLEADRYAQLVGSELALQLDERPLELRVVNRHFPPLTELRTGLGTIRLELGASVQPLSGQSHELSFQNRHRPDLSVYLVNALMPRSPDIQVVQQARSENQSESRIRFTHREMSQPASGTAETSRPRFVWFGLRSAGAVIALIASVTWFRKWPGNR